MGQRPSVLVVDDDRDLGGLLAELLAEHGYDVRTASSGPEAVAMLSSGFVPDAMLLDLFMPAMTGWEVMRAMRERALERVVPVLVMSGMRVDDRPAGAVGFLPKPVRADQVLRLVARCVSGEALRERLAEEAALRPPGEPDAEVGDGESDPSAG